MWGDCGLCGVSVAWYEFVRHGVGLVVRHGMSYGMGGAITAME